VELIIEQKLRDSDLLKDPKVSVSAITYRKFFISGEVQKPDGYNYQPGLTVDRAVALAGGLTERASKKKITITRGSGDKRSEEQAEFNSKVEPGDTITIDQGFF
jgi:protein involved in polysaccharide export with SLBB domain